MIRSLGSIVPALLNLLLQRWIDERLTLNNLHAALIEFPESMKRKTDPLKSVEYPINMTEVKNVNYTQFIGHLKFNQLYHASKEERPKNDIDMHTNILKTALVNQELLSEILTMVFNKERSKLEAYNSESAIKMAKQLAEKYLKGGERL